MDIFLVLLLGIIAGLILGAFVIFKIRRKKKQDFNMQGHEEYLESIKVIESKLNKPNIIIILTDDMGYADISCFGAKTLKTPSIDKIAEEGVIFTNFHSSAPVCSPSRAGLLTGRYPVRTHVPTVFIPSKSIFSPFASLFLYSHGMKGISLDEITIAEVLKAIGYKTGMVGKWHLGDKEPFIPNNKGFDFFYGAHYSNDMKPYEIYRNDKVEIETPVDQDQLTKHLTEEAINFIKTSDGNPFFLYYAQPFPHAPLHASDDFKKTSKAGIYGDCIQEVDWSIGKILETLDDMNLTEKTLIFFTSDNGPWQQGNPGYARGRKGLVYEGGQRVPFIARWPNNIPAGKKTDISSMNIDLLPTLLEIIGLPLPDDRIIDGTSIKKVLLEPENEEHKSRPIFYFWNKHLKAIRRDKWKFHLKHMSDISTYFMLKHAPMLFNLEKDPNESYDQTTHYPEKVKELDDEINKMKISLKKNLRGWKNKY